MRRLVGLVLGLVWLSASTAWAATAHVQSKDAVACCSQSSLAISTTSNVTAGNGLALGIYTNGDSGSFTTISSITTTSCQSNTFTDGGDNPRSSTVGNGQGFAYYAKNITGGACTITVNLSASVTLIRLQLTEFSGADTAAPLGQHAGNWQNTPGTGTDAVTSGTVTTATNGEFVWGFTASSNDPTINVGTGFTLGAGGGVSKSEYLVQGAAGNTAATFTGTSGPIDSITMVMTFKESGSAPPNMFFRRRVN